MAKKKKKQKASQLANSNKSNRQQSRNLNQYQRKQKRYLERKQREKEVQRSYQKWNLKNGNSNSIL